MNRHDADVAKFARQVAEGEADQDNVVTMRRRAKLGRFAKGVSGNPGGRRLGVPNKATVLRAAFAEANAEDVLGFLLRHAMEDANTCKWLAERLFGGGNWNPGLIDYPSAKPTPDNAETAGDEPA